ncbi:glycosyltransferase family 2 protein [Nocardioides coralli]|uniref:glycosyltransferase family 2 protein n=1 Tax=Nocardioides coralli TaxID=2872154 RepID=UPI001CA3DA1C|nr:glycosyltransferase family 2 protein [Nocardioides coralli]QZY28497.1 glycosyltransferase family 2 protein [Nocardioides coralli]
MTAQLDRGSFTYSIVIPVYNSAGIVGETVDRVVSVFREAGLRFEVILVNDGSPDDSWSVISERAAQHPEVVALDLMRNYGQHYANMAGLTEASGDYVITMDDDLQNPPDQALVLIDAAMAGHDVVFGKFDQKKAAGFRRIGSKLIGMINRRIFGQPADLVVSNFRILRRDVVDRIVASRTAYPYITGQALMYSGARANALVRHEPRPVGKSNYNLVRILRLVVTILFSYSSWPLRAAAVLGFTISGLSFLLGGFLVVRGLATDSVVPGWTSLMVLLSLFAGFIIALLSMIGEYVVRTLNTVSTDEWFHVVQRVGR